MEETVIKQVAQSCEVVLCHGVGGEGGGVCAVKHADISTKIMPQLQQAGGQQCWKGIQPSK